MPRSLVSYWKRVATSGTTADGRDITPQELRDIAETYKPSRYTAVIWCDHERWPGSHGTVFAVRLVEPEDDPELEDGQVALEAQLKPNDKLLYLNDRGEKLFGGIEITPNFANSGKAYLTGLGITDEPASLGTQELYFSARSSKAAYFAASVELGALREPEAAPGEKGLITALTAFFKRFATETLPSATTPQTPTESKPPMDEATANALSALVEQLLIVAAGIQTVIEPVTVEVDDPDNQELTDTVESAVQDIVDKADEEREFNRSRRRAKNSGVEARLAGIEKQFSRLLDNAAGRDIPRNRGPQQQPKKKVF